MHGPLHESALRLRDGEFVVAYLDDIYLLTPRDRARKAYDIVAEILWRRAGVHPNAGKLECWAKGGGSAPRGVQELGTQGEAPVWKGNLLPSRCGVEVLGSPLSSPGFVQAQLKARAADEARFFKRSPN